MWWCVHDERLVQVEGMGNGICWCMQGIWLVVGFGCYVGGVFIRLMLVSSIWMWMLRMCRCFRWWLCDCLCACV